MRDKLLEEMPTLDAFATKSRRGWVWPMVALLAVGVGVGGAYWVMSRAQTAETATPTEALDEGDYVAELSEQDRDAARQGLYIYPPATDPSAATAYGRIRELEALEGDQAEDARRQAQRLRQEFAAQLVRLGDEHYDRPGGEAIAGDYYAQALLFDREHPRALERTSVPDEQLDALVTKAQSGEFSAAEIEKAEAQRKRDRKVLANVRDDLGKGKSDGGASEVVVAPPPEPAKPASAEEKSARELSELARSLYRKGDTAKAADFVARALIFNPKDEVALSVRYDIRSGKGDHAGALETAKKLVAAAGSRGANQMKLGKAHAKLGQWKDAYAAYAKAVELGAKGADAALTDAAEHGGGPMPGTEPPPSDAPDPPQPAPPQADDGKGDAGVPDDPPAEPDDPPPPTPAKTTDTPPPATTADGGA